MKKFLIIAFASLLSVSAFAQGTVNFNNSASSLIIDPRTGVGAAAGGAFTVALYWGVAGTTDASALVQIGATGLVNPTPGRYSAGTRTTGVGTAPGANAVFQVRAWETSGGSTWDQALASGVYYGSSALFTSATGGAGEPPSAAVSLSATVPGFTMVPEPSTFALGALGLGALLMVRRRKV
ncbi:MAG: PEP-CTERM sorting domain-containing protein [Verrucomicrobia bacterium]|nr:PEP-CTERM sorting domain-containing protein [Verrucomicrobiota bacterium]